MWDIVVGAGLLVADWAYHYLTKDDPKDHAAREVQIPRTEDGVAVPMIFGTVRVDRPILVYTSSPKAEDTVDQFPGLSDRFPLSYTMDMLFVLGTGFVNGTSRCHRVWAGDYELASLSYLHDGGPTQLAEETGEGATTGTPVGVVRLDNGAVSADNGVTTGTAEFRSGVSDQILDDTTYAGTSMAAATGDPAQVMDLRGYLSLFLGGGVGFDQWIVGPSPSVPAYSMEVSSFPGVSDSFDEVSIGAECNPADAIKRLLVGGFSELGLSNDFIDYETFQAAAATLDSEGHGFSNVFDSTSDAGEMIDAILQQIYGVLYVESTTQRFCLKLIRQDYDVATMPVVNESNCTFLRKLQAVGRTNLASKVRVVYSDRIMRYADNSCTAHNQAAGARFRTEVTLRHPGIKTAAVAQQVADREISARSRPLLRCQATVDRRLLRVNSGDALRVSWSKANISDVVMRVGNVNRGDRTSNDIVLDLVQDFGYLRRGAVVGVGGTVGAPPTVLG